MGRSKRSTLDNAVLNEDMDIVFQAIDWRDYHENRSTDEEETHEEYFIRIFGTMADGKKIYVSVKGFEPYFHIKIPNKWLKDSSSPLVKKVKKFIDKFIGNNNDSPTEFETVCRNSMSSFSIVQKTNLYGFNDGKQHHFICLKFNNMFGYKKVCYHLKSNKIYDPNLRKMAKFEIFDSNLDPTLRCIHVCDLEACGWIKINGGQYKSIKNITSNEIAIETTWDNLMPHKSNNLAPIVIASFDIECVSQDGSFPKADRDSDKIITIGTTFNRCGESECFYKHVVQLDTCDDIDGVDVEWYSSERTLLIAWTNMIQRMNPDILTGWNIFGFDYNYIKIRAKKLGCEIEFEKLGRINNERAKFVKKELSSSALGNNELLYYDMTGRIQVDLMKAIQGDPNHKLDSYKLDYVSSHFIREKIDSVDVNAENKTSTIHTENTFGLDIGRYIKIYYNDGLSDTSYKEDTKFEVIGLEKNKIVIKGILEDEALETNIYSVFWCQAKDDLPPHKIFEYQKMTSKERTIIAKYCVQDCILCNKLIEKLQIVVNNVGMSNVCSVPLQYIFLRGQGIKILSLVSRKCSEKGFVVPTLEKKELDEFERAYEGATVFESDGGIYFEPIPVLDYKSLYPSSMIHRNLSHECLIMDEKYLEPDKMEELKTKYTIYSVEHVNPKTGDKKTSHFVKDKNGSMGLIPEILKFLLDARSDTKKQMGRETDPFKKSILDGLQLAYKVTANSLYGQTGAMTSSIYLKDIAASTTATGREMLNAAKLFCENIFPIIAQCVVDKNEKKYKKSMKRIFDNKMDKLLKDDIDVLKERNDYRYLRIFSEREEITDDDFKPKYESKEDFINKFYNMVEQALDGTKITPNCVYGDTDSVFINYGIVDLETGEKLTDKRSRCIAIKIGILCGDLINYILPHPQELEYEKTFHPWITLSKKRYVGNLYKENPNKYEQKSMGIVLKRRDNAPIVKIVVGGIVKSLLNSRSIDKAVELTKDELLKLIHGHYRIDKFIISKTLKDKKDYSDWTRIVHAVLADRMARRDEGNKPQSNDRIPYVFVVPEDGKEIKLQGDRVEHPSYILENNLQIDYLYYITNQIMKPAEQFLDLMMSNPRDIIKDFIRIEENRKKGIKAICSYDEGTTDFSFSGNDGFDFGFSKVEPKAKRGRCRKKK